MSIKTIRTLILYPLTFVLFLGGIILFPVLFLLRTFHSKWGATSDEVNSAMPGDSEIKSPIFQATRAVTINVNPEVVWPWLAQMGYRRAGWYGFDQFDNDGIPSSTCILYEFQNPQIGQVIGEEGLTVRTIEPNRSLVLSFSHLITVWVFKDGIWPKFGASSLSYRLDQLGPERTRLIVRMRFNAKLFSIPILWWPFFEIGDFFNARKQLLGIKSRAESHLTA